MVAKEKDQYCDKESQRRFEAHSRAHWTRPTSR